MKRKGRNLHWLKMNLILFPISSILFIAVFALMMIAVLLDISQRICFPTAVLVYIAGFIGIAYFAAVSSLGS